MTDTIELLEAIGRDASLRHATAEELQAILEQVDAPEVLTAAVASGDSVALAAALGYTRMQTTQITQHPCHEEEEDEDGDTDGEDEDEADASRAPERDPPVLPR